jgi:multiple sugar transport system ATP-binding protein
MRASLAELHERLHVTTVYVTHDQVEAMTLGHRVCVLRDGMLQQVDTPQNLYDHPVNLFVGGFIGSPSMNIVKAGVVSGDDGMAVTFAGYRLPIPEEVVRASSGIEAYVGRDVILGIRPSDFEDASLTDDSWPRMPVVTHVTEALGSDINVIFAIDAPPFEHKDLADLVPEQEEEGSAIPLYEGKSLWTARVNARSPVRAGDRIELGVDTRNLHFFDPDSGLAIGGTKIAAS